MADYTREQLFDALRKADAAGDAEAAKALTVKIKQMDAGGPEAVQAAIQQGKSRDEILAVAQQNNLQLNEQDLDANLAARAAGQQTAEVQQPSNWDYLATSAQNIGAGLVEGALGVAEFPYNVADTINQGVRSGLRYVGGGLADLLGLNGDAVRNDGIESVPRIPMPSEQIQALSPTPEGMEGQRFGAQIVGGMAVPFGPKPTIKPAPVAQQATKQPNSLREIVEAGEANNVRVMTSDVKPPQTFLTRMAQNVGERIPIAGTGGPRAAQQGERVEAVKKVAEDFGVEVGGNYVEDVAADLAKTRGARLSKLSAQKDRIIEGVQGAVQAPRAIEAIDRQIARLSSINAEAFAPVVAKLQNFKDTLGKGLSLSQVEGNRKLLGDLFADPSLAAIKGDGQKALNAIYGPLREDMAAHIKAVGGNNAYKAWREANDGLAQMAGELSVGTFKRVLADAESTPENVGRLLFSQKPSDVKRLMANISPEGRAKAQAAIIERALSKAGDDVSPDKFANEITRLGKQVGVVFEGQDLARIQGLERLLQATKRAAQASVTPPTGVQNTPIVGGYAAGTVLGSAAIPYAALVGLAARAYESAPVRNLLIGLSKTQPGSKAEGRMIERLEKAIVSQSSVNPAVNDNVGMSLAASETEEQ